MNPNDRSKLFAGFPPVTTPEWESKILADLKGADYEKKLIWKTEEGFDVKPYYRAEDLQELGYLNSMPGEFPFVRGNKKDANDWLVRQDFTTPVINEANHLALEAISRGATALGLNATEITSHEQMKQLLAKIDLMKINLNFISSRSYPLTLELLIYEVSGRGKPAKKLNGSINFDPISYLLLHGDFHINWRSNIEEAEYLLNTATKHLPSFRVLTVNGHYFQDAGSTLVQEVAFTLASGCEYLDGLTGKGFTADQLGKRILLSMAAGSNYFMEIAKFRAIRFLWAKVMEQFGAKDPESVKAFIHSSTADWNKTMYDPYVNLLRTTTEAMSAALGNADSLAIGPFDSSFRHPDEFSGRIALNQQMVLKEESYLDKIIDPAAGSYYIETLTDSIIFHSWKLFLDIEERGGIIEAIKSGYVQEEIGKARNGKEKDIDQRKMVLIGTNQYPNLQENMLDKLEEKKETVKSITSLYTAMTPFRASGAFDEIRLATERFIARGNRKPSVFLFTMGNLAMLRARAGFATNFFGCAGYEIIDNPGFQTVDEGVEAARASGAPIIVICSSDQEYPEIAPEICKKIKQNSPSVKIIVAGYPKEIIETLKKEGVDNFIHVRSNLLETLKKYHTLLGIENQ
ncbi:MAG: methylmalonyl-CoA mutase family protein [bacterium]